jgi:ribonuclease PH
MAILEDSTGRPDGRAPDEIRQVRFEVGFTRAPLASVLVSAGNTKVLCTVSREPSVPPWLEGQGKGWITAEYSLLPGASGERVPREAVRGKQSGRTQEIQRLIGRSLRAVTDLSLMPGLSLLVDCDVLEADGGTRTASINGAYVALECAVSSLLEAGEIPSSPIKEAVAAVSVGIVDGRPVLDLTYEEDASADVDMNVVMSGSGRFVEIQGTAEGAPFSRGELDKLIELAEKGIKEVMALQQEAVKRAGSPGR